MPGSHTQWTMNACVQLIAELRSNATNYQQHPDVWVHLQMTVHSGLQPSCMYQGAEYSRLCMLCPVFWWIECTNTSLAPLHFGVICYVDLTGTMVFIKFIERFVWAFTLENEGKGKLIKGPLYGGKFWWLVCFRVNGLAVSLLVSCEWPLMSVQVSPFALAFGVSYFFFFIFIPGRTLPSFFWFLFVLWYKATLNPHKFMCLRGVLCDWWNDK